VLVVSVDATKGAFDAIVAGKLACAVECSPLLGPRPSTRSSGLRRGETVLKRTVVQDKVFDARNAAAERPNRKY
jgi:simple sugar transport system substrate-binding protein